MKQITYQYTNVPKQVFILLLQLNFLLRLIVIAQIYIYKLPDYHEKINYPVTIAIYLSLIIILNRIFVGYKYFGSIYNEEELTYRNALLHKEYTLKFKDAKQVWFGQRGVHFYREKDGHEKNQKPLFFLPFFRGGKIDAVSINSFFVQMKNNENIRVVKDFKVLPGYSNSFKIITAIYIFLCIVAFANTTTPIKAAAILFMNHQ